MTQTQETTAQETTQQEQETQEQEKPVMNANQIIAAMAKLFAALETQYTINEANMRGALATMLHELDK